MRCPACVRFTRFYGLIYRPAVWARWEICDHCEAYFIFDAQGALVWGRRAITPDGYPWDPPFGWFRPLPILPAESGLTVRHARGRAYDGRFRSDRTV